MKRLIVPALALALVCAALASPAQAAGVTYSIQPTPDFAFIGESVSFAVSGVPMSYVFLMAHAEDNLTDEATIADEFTQLDYRGLAVINITVPVEAPAGDYVATLLVDGTAMANCSFTVLFDFETYTDMRLDLLEDENSDLKDRNAVLTAKANALQGQLDVVSSCTYVITGMCVFACVYLWVNRADWRAWNASMITRARGLEDNMKRSWYMITHPRPEGEMTLLHPGMMAKMEEMRDELQANGKPVKGAKVIMADPNSALGFRTYDLETLELKPIEIKAEAEVVPKKKSPETMPEKPSKPVKVRSGGLFARRPARAPEPKPARAEKPSPGRFHLFKSREEPAPMSEEEPEPYVADLEETPEPEVVPKSEPKPKSAPRKKATGSAKPTATKSAQRKRAPAKPKTPKAETEGSP